MKLNYRLEIVWVEIVSEALVNRVLCGGMVPCMSLSLVVSTVSIQQSEAQKRYLASAYKPLPFLV